MSVFTSAGTENQMRWDRKGPGFMEVWYSTLNHSPSGSGVWVRYTITAPRRGDPYCELWGFLFDPEGKRNFAGKQRFPIERLGSPNGRDDGALVRIGDAWLSESHLEGELTKGDRSLEWSLDFEPAGRCFQHIPQPLRKRVEQRVSTVCSPNLSVPFTGVVKVDGDPLDFDSESGCQSHRWGRKHSLSWVWAHCSRFEGEEDVVLEGVSARTKMGFVPIPTMSLLYLRYRGEDIAFNELRWALRARSHYEMPTWAFTARTDKWKVVGAARAQVDRMVQVEYTDPDGSHRYCANTEIAGMAVEVYARSGSAWRHQDSLTALGTAHLEFGRKEPFVELPVAF
jgi:hypothetical protein